MKICLLGIQGSGKGTLAQDVQGILNIPVISVGAIFRKEIADETKIGKKAQRYVYKGVNVPARITNRMVITRLQQPDCKSGFIIDGFPRNMKQAKALNKKIKLDKVFNLEIDENLIIDRLSSRLSCEKCSTVYNTKTYKKKKCEKCGGKLTQRVDDNPESIRNRIETTKKETFPVVEYYKKKGIVETLDANKTPQEVKEQFLEVLGIKL